MAPLTIGPDGTIYGVTSRGGNDSCFNGCGIVFRLTPPPNIGIVTLASPVYYNETVTAITASTTAPLSCSVLYPFLAVYVQRGGQTLTLGTNTVGTGPVTQLVIDFSALQPGDVVTTQLVSPGSGCTGLFPLTVTFTAQFTATLSTNLSNLATGEIGANGFILAIEGEGRAGAGDVSENHLVPNLDDLEVLTTS